MAMNNINFANNKCNKTNERKLRSPQIVLSTFRRTRSKKIPYILSKSKRNIIIAK